MLQAPLLRQCGKITDVGALTALTQLQALDAAGQGSEVHHEKVTGSSEASMLKLWDNIAFNF
jgi:hypothetical protein